MVCLHGWDRQANRDTNSIDGHLDSRKWNYKGLIREVLK